MFRLTREVRFSINNGPDRQPGERPTNSFGGFPSMTGLGRYYTARVTLAGALDPNSQYLLNIKDVDDAVRAWLLSNPPVDGSAMGLLQSLADELSQAWPERFAGLSLLLTPTLSLAVGRSGDSMVRLSQKFEFSASHRLHNPALSDDENRHLFGKCNNPLGHGHNYEVQVTLRGQSAPIASQLRSLPEFERVVEETVIARLDHKHLNLEVPEFAELIPSVENIAKVIFRLLKPRFVDGMPPLDSVTVWETRKTWCEYRE